METTKKDLLEAKLNHVICDLVQDGITILSSLKFNSEHSIFKQIMVAVLDFETGELDSHMMGLGFVGVNSPDKGVKGIKVENVKSLLRQEFIYKLLITTMQKEIDLLKKQSSVPADQPLQITGIPTPRCERVAQIPRCSLITR